jgi:hypothetical protein
MSKPTLNDWLRREKDLNSSKPISQRFKAVKPKKHTIEYYDYHECRDYLQEKYGYNERDYAGRHKKKEELDHFRLYQKLTGDIQPFDGHYPDCSGKGGGKTIWRDGKKIPATEEQYRADFDLIHAQYRRYQDWTLEHPETPKPPYQDFWHFVVEQTELSNGSMFTMSDDWLEYAEGWQKTILEYYLSEFGEGEEREIQFQVNW